jgi:predicted nucleic acid-binding protein
MPTGAEPRAVLLLDTSAAIAFCVMDHEAHATTFARLATEELGLAGHAAFETYSVLTRLPGASRLSASAAARVLDANFPATRHLSSAAALPLLASFAAHNIAGGSVYDGLVAAAALEHDLVLVSRDRRAADTYRRVGVRLELLA